MLVCVGLATCDTIVPTAEMPGPDGRVEVPALVHAGGGPAATTAVVLARLGAPTAFVGVVGDDEAGRRVADELADEGVATSGLAVVPGFATPESCVLVDPVSQSRSIFTTGSTSRLTDEIAHLVWENAAHLWAGASWVHLDHYGWRLWAAGPASSTKARVSIDAGNPIAGLSLGHVSLYAPTLAQIQLRYEGKELGPAMAAAHAEGAEVVVVTAGAKGCYVSSGEGGTEHVPAAPAPVLSTLGAGDAFHAGLVFGLAQGMGAADAARLATAVAAESCLAWDGRSGVRRRARPVGTATTGAGTGKDWAGKDGTSMSPSEGATSAMHSAMQKLSTSRDVFALVALDQRESLRAYLAEAKGEPVDDAGVIAFKEATLRDLSAHASGVLLDLDFGVPALAQAGPGAGGLVLAADELAQDVTGAIVATDLDMRVGRAEVAATSCSALKLLVIWRPTAGEEKQRRDLVERFMSRCRSLGVLGLVEALMDGPTRQRARGDADSRLYLAMAEEMAGYGPDIYKTEVPGEPTLPAGVLSERAAAISARLACPWVLLSNGVPPEAYPGVVAAVCEGGASGFLAGRAIWRLAISAQGYDPQGGARERLGQLVEIVNQKGRPWPEVVGPGAVRGPQ